MREKERESERERERDPEKSTQLDGFLFYLGIANVRFWFWFENSAADHRN